MNKHLKIIEILEKRKDYITGKELVERLNIVNTQFLRDMIKNLRDIGFPIIASGQGYKLAKSGNELVKYKEIRNIEIRREMNSIQSMCMKELRVLKSFIIGWGK